MAGRFVHTVCEARLRAAAFRRYVCVVLRYEVLLVAARPSGAETASSAVLGALAGGRSACRENGPCGRIIPSHGMRRESSIRLHLIGVRGHPWHPHPEMPVGAAAGRSSFISRPPFVESGPPRSFAPSQKRFCFSVAPTRCLACVKQVLLAVACRRVGFAIQRAGRGPQPYR